MKGNTKTLSVRIDEAIEERIKRLAQDRRDGVEVTTSQIVRAALLHGLSFMERELERSNG